MKRIYVEQAQPTDSDALIAAMDSTPKNLCDPQVFKYPATKTLKTVKEGKPMVFMPVHPVFMLESLGISKEASELDVAVSLSRLIEIVRWEGHSQGHGEMFFACVEESTQKFAEKHGFELVNVPMYKLRIR